MTSMQINTNQSDKKENRLQKQQNMAIGGDKNVTDVKQGNDSGYDAEY